MSHLKTPIVFFLVSLLFPLSASAVEIHPQPTCTTGSLQTLDWGSVSWSPTGATSFTATNVNGTGVDVTFSYTGDTGNFATLSGSQTPTTNGTVLSADPTLDMFVNPGISGDTDGVDDITLNISFSPAVEGNVAFDFYHVNGSSFSGDQLTTSSDLGNPPTFNGNATPSWNEPSPGFVQATSGSTTGTNDQAGVTFTDTNQAMNDITIIWEDCENICGTGQHGYGLGNIDFCLLPPPVADDDSADAGGNTSVTLDALNNDSVNVNAPTGTTLDPVTFDFDPSSVGGTCVTTDADGDCTEVNVPGQGIWTVDTSGMVTFSAFSSFAGSPSPIDYFIEDSNGYASNIATISITNVTPVTLSSFNSARSGGTVDVNWGTSSELFNVGFQLWGLDGTDGQWEKLHNWLVKSGSGNAVEPQSYRRKVNIPGRIHELVALGLSSVDNDGTEHYYGPFEVGHSYGNLGKLEPIAWNTVRAELDARLSVQGYVRDRYNRYIKVVDEASSSGLSSTSLAEFQVSEAGLYRITASELMDLNGEDWSEVSKGEIALIDADGQGVVRYVVAKGIGSGTSRTLGSGGEIYFFGKVPDRSKGLYTDSSVYRLVKDSTRALQAPLQHKQKIIDGFSTSYIEHSLVEHDSQYILTSAADDPWLNQVIVSYADLPSLYGVAVPIEADALLDQSMRLSFSLGKSSDLSGSGDEHQVQGLVVSPEGEYGILYLDTQSSNDSGPWEVGFDVPANTPLTRNTNGDSVVGAAFSPGAGYSFSEMHIDHVVLSYSRPYTAKASDDHLYFEAPHTGELGYEVMVPDTGWPIVFASDGDNLVRILPERAPRVTDKLGQSNRLVRFASLIGSQSVKNSRPLSYWVSGKSGYLGVEGLVSKSILNQSTMLAQAQHSNYLLISHPSFMGAKLDSYAAHKQAQGYTPSIINYLDIVDAFGGGQPGPEGLTRYLDAVETMYGQLDHVLLVGGSSYDHTNKLGSGAVTFIPGHYGQSGYSQYTVSDVPYIKNNENGLFASIGRWPVRTMKDLDVIVEKSMAWASADHSSGQVLLIAEHTVEGEGIDFGRALDSVAQTTPANYAQTKVYVDEILEANPGITLTQALVKAKSAIVDELNAGPDLVLYNGHASTHQLSNQNLFKASDISQVASGVAQMWLPMSCYVTYYESTNVNTMAHQLLFTGDAVAISGAMLLSNQRNNIQIGKRILNQTLNEGATLGDAVNNAKAAQANPETTIIWALLGDPTSKFK